MPGPACLAESGLASVESTSLPTYLTPLLPSFPCLLLRGFGGGVLSFFFASVHILVGREDAKWRLGRGPRVGSRFVPFFRRRDWVVGMILCLAWPLLVVYCSDRVEFTTWSLEG